jgi:hypothetical protein
MQRWHEGEPAFKKGLATEDTSLGYGVSRSRDMLQLSDYLRQARDIFFSFFKIWFVVHVYHTVLQQKGADLQLLDSISANGAYNVHLRVLVSRTSCSSLRIAYGWDYIEGVATFDYRPGDTESP